MNTRTTAKISRWTSFRRSTRRVIDWESVVKLARVTETGEVPARQGVTMENIGHIRPRTNVDRRDASSVECRGSFTTGS